MPSPLALVREVRRRLLIHRRGLAALCAAAALLITIRAVQPADVATVGVWVAAHDLAAGSELADTDLRRTGFPPAAVPAGAVRDASALIGRTLVQPLERGQLLSSRQLLGRSALIGFPDRVAIAVRIPDAGIVGLLHATDHIDLWATDPRTPGPARLLVADAIVLTTSAPAAAAGSRSGAVGSGALVVLAVAPDDVAKVASATSSDFLTVAWNR